MIQERNPAFTPTCNSVKDFLNSVQIRYEAIKYKQKEQETDPNDCLQ